MGGGHLLTHLVSIVDEDCRQVHQVERLADRPFGRRLASPPPRQAHIRHGHRCRRIRQYALAREDETVAPSAAIDRRMNGFASSGRFSAYGGPQILPICVHCSLRVFTHAATVAAAADCAVQNSSHSAALPTLRTKPCRALL